MVAQNFREEYRAVIVPVVFKWDGFIERNRLLIYDKSTNLAAEISQTYYQDECCTEIGIDFFSAKFEDEYYSLLKQNEEKFDVEQFLSENFGIKSIFDENRNFKFEYI